MGRLGRMLLLVNLLFAMGCLSEEDQQLIDDVLQPTPAPPAPPVDEVDPHCYLQRYTQPAGEVSKKVDLLFVIDTSSSLDEERTEIANGIDSFIDNLPVDVDLQVAVMLAHGSTSAHSGRLYRKGSEAAVLRSTELTHEQLRDQLRAKMDRWAPEDAGSDGGESGLFSLNKALTELASGAATSSGSSSGSESGSIGDSGFFRDDAALATIFVADENDICAVYPEGVTPVPDPNHKEVPSFERDCGEVTAESVVDRLRELKGELPLLVGGILYTDPATVPWGGENEVGYGYLDAIDLDLGIAIDLATGSYSAGLAEIGRLVTVKLETLKDFRLTTLGVVPDTIEVKVDGIATPFLYTPQTRTVHLDGAGGPLSTVDIYYCTAEQAIF